MADVEVLEMDSAKDFFDLLRPSNDRWWDGAESQYVFRGHSDSSWALTPSGLRPLGPTNKLTALYREIERRLDTGELRWANPSDAKYAEFIIWRSALSEALHQFSLLCRDVGLWSAPVSAKSILAGEKLWNPQNGPAFAMLPLAQHHGVPTERLDWTSNPMAAAFFACSDGSCADVCVWALRETIEFPRARPTVGVENMGIHFERPTVEHNSFMRAQGGLFTQVQQEDEFFKKFGKWPDLETINCHLDQNLLTKITLCRSEVASLLQLLFREKYSLAHLKPSLDNVSKTVLDRLQSF